MKFVTVKSKHLKGRGDITLFEPKGNFEAGLPVVTLLHGVYGSHWAWAYSGGAHRVAQRLIDEGVIEPMVLAMPSDGLFGDGSSYTAHNGCDYERWIVDDVFQAACEVSEWVDDTSPRFIAGLSMGGYGALRLGARNAHVFSGISGHSSITRFTEHEQFLEEPLEALHPADQHEDLDVIGALQAHAAALPPLRFDCGTGDPLIEGNRLLHQQLDEDGIPHVYEEFPGAHTWEYWHEHLADSLRFFSRAAAGR